MDASERGNLDPTSPERERYWKRKLGRLRLGVEPIDLQLEKYRRVTLMLTAVPLGIGIMFVGLFTAFERPDIGLWIVGLILVPIIVLAWVDFFLLRRAARAFEAERRQYDERDARGERKEQGS